MPQFTINFSDDAYETLEELKEKTHKTSLAEVIRSALSLYRWSIEQKEEGRKVTSMKGKEVKEVILP